GRGLGPLLLHVPPRVPRGSPGNESGMAGKGARVLEQAPGEGGAQAGSHPRVQRRLSPARPQTPFHARSALRSGLFSRPVPVATRRIEDMFFTEEPMSSYPERPGTKPRLLAVLATNASGEPEFHLCAPYLTDAEYAAGRQDEAAKCDAA